MNIINITTNVKNNEIYLDTDTKDRFTLDLVKTQIRFNDKLAKHSDLEKIENDISYISNNYGQKYNNGEDKNKPMLNWTYFYFQVLKILANANRNSRYGSSYYKFKRLFTNSYAEKAFENNSSKAELLAKSGIPVRRYLEIEIEDIKLIPSEYKINPYEMYIPTKEYTNTLREIVTVEKAYKLNPRLEPVYTYFLSILKDKNIIAKSFDVKAYFINSDFSDLINKYKYDPKKLVDYLEEDVRWQGLPPMSSFLNRNNYYSSSARTLLLDYAKMSFELNSNTKFDKYPKYLKTVHDIVQMNYDCKIDEIKNKKFITNVNSKEYIKFDNYSYNKYLVLAPKQSEDLTKEGSALHHCVGSYISDVLEGMTKILFIRSKKEPEESLLTMEVKNNRVNQVKGHSNRQVNPDEYDFVKHFAKKFNLEYA